MQKIGTQEHSTVYADKYVGDQVFFTFVLSLYFWFSLLFLPHFRHLLNVDSLSWWVTNVGAEASEWEEGRIIYSIDINMYICI